MRVLLTGSDGYLGSVVGPHLLGLGHRVVGVDAGLYRTAPLMAWAGDRPECRTLDVRDLRQEDLEGFDAVVHLAELSNDPLSELDPALTYAVNHLATVELARRARAAGVERFVHMSSCSVYGVSERGLVSEASPARPQTTYARCKLWVERDVGALASDGFSPTFLRSATAFGASPAMRFDLVVNDLAGSAWTSGSIRMISDGSPWRPLIHTRDIAQAIGCVLAAPRDAVHAEVLNLGAEGRNHQVKEIAGIVADVFGDCALEFGEARPEDTRSYRVGFDRIRSRLPDFSPSWTVERGVEELRDIFAATGLDRASYASSAWCRVARLDELLAADRLDPTLRWRTTWS